MKKILRGAALLAFGLAMQPLSAQTTFSWLGTEEGAQQVAHSGFQTWDGTCSATSEGNNLTITVTDRPDGWFGGGYVSDAQNWSQLTENDYKLTFTMKVTAQEGVTFTPFVQLQVLGSPANEIDLNAAPYNVTLTGDETNVEIPLKSFTNLSQQITGENQQLQLGFGGNNGSETINATMEVSDIKMVPGKLTEEPGDEDDTQGECPKKSETALDKNGNIQYVVNYNKDKTLTITLISAPTSLSNTGAAVTNVQLVDVKVEGSNLAGKTYNLNENYQYTTEGKFNPRDKVDWNWYLVYEGGVDQKQVTYEVPEHPYFTPAYAVCFGKTEIKETSFTIDYKFVNITNVADDGEHTYELEYDIDGKDALPRVYESAGTLEYTGLDPDTSYNIYPKGKVDGKNTINFDNIGVHNIRTKAKENPDIPTPVEPVDPIDNITAGDFTREGPTNGTKAYTINFKADRSFDGIKEMVVYAVREVDTNKDEVPDEGNAKYVSDFVTIPVTELTGDSYEGTLTLYNLHNNGNTGIWIKVYCVRADNDARIFDHEVGSGADTEVKEEMLSANFVPGSARFFPDETGTSGTLYFDYYLDKSEDITVVNMVFGAICPDATEDTGDRWETDNQGNVEDAKMAGRAIIDGENVVSGQNNTAAMRLEYLPVNGATVYLKGYVGLLDNNRKYIGQMDVHINTTGSQAGDDSRKPTFTMEPLVEGDHITAEKPNRANTKAKVRVDYTVGNIVDELSYVNVVVVQNINAYTPEEFEKIQWRKNTGYVILGSTRVLASELKAADTESLSTTVDINNLVTTKSEAQYAYENKIEVKFVAYFDDATYAIVDGHEGQFTLDATTERINPRVNEMISTANVRSGIIFPWIEGEGGSLTRHPDWLELQKDEMYDTWDEIKGGKLHVEDESENTQYNPYAVWKVSPLTNGRLRVNLSIYYPEEDHNLPANGFMMALHMEVNEDQGTANTPDGQLHITTIRATDTQLTLMSIEDAIKDVRERYPDQAEGANLMAMRLMDEEGSVAAKDYEFETIDPVVDENASGNVSFRYNLQFANGGKTESTPVGVYAVNDGGQTSGIEDVYVDTDFGTDRENQSAASAVEPVYYNLQGIRLNAPVPGQVTIKVQGNKVEKIIVR